MTPNSVDTLFKAVQYEVLYFELFMSFHPVTNALQDLQHLENAIMLGLEFFWEFHKFISYQTNTETVT